MWKFFDRYPDAKSAAAANQKDIQNMIQPLGLSERRSRALIKMSDGYLKDSWRETPEVLYGIGKYASDAYRIFCLGRWQDVEPKDHALNDYHCFLKKHAADELEIRENL
tara:strand:+ start:437 stop:763 length:327 start_codon:yes stop_codon:yes gene_type:complete